jgi:hypothetical protein
MVKKIDWLAGGLGGISILTAALPAWTYDTHPLVDRSSDARSMGKPTSVMTRSNSSGSIAPESKSPFWMSQGVSSIAPPETLTPSEVTPRSDSLDASSAADNSADDAMEQVTSVSQLSDVKPSDWAYQALKSLVERYGVIDGYPDGTFRGNRPLSRYEFAAVLNTVVSRIEEQLASGDLGGTAQQDVLTIRRLINAYGQELETLRSRLDTITNRVGALERQQFSTTTKLNGRIDLALTDGTDSFPTLVQRTRLDLITSFRGTDRFVTELEAGNQGRDAIALAHDSFAAAPNATPRPNLLGTTGVLADGGGNDAVGATPEIKLRKLYYAFRPSENLEVAVGSNIPPSDFIDRNGFANQSGQNFASSFFANNPLIVQNEIDRFGGAGATVAWNVRNNLTLRALYAAADASNPLAGAFRDRYQATLEAEYEVPNEPIKVRLQYTHGDINGTAIDAAGLNAEWAIQRPYGVFGIFARLGVGSYRGFNSVLGEDLDLNPKTWALGISAQNFLIPGSKAGIAIGQPFVTSKLGNATQTNIEAFFGLALNDHINFSPSLLIVSNPNNRAGETIWEWALRVLYAF